jgi:hypothetical protein
MKYNKKAIDYTFGKSAFYMEMSGQTAPVQHLLMSCVDMLKMIRNKSQDKKLHAKNEDVNALKTVIYEKDDLSKSDIQNILKQIYTKFSIDSEKPSISHLGNYIKSEASNAKLELSKTFSNSINNAKEIIKKNVR